MKYDSNQAKIYIHNMRQAASCVLLGDNLCYKGKEGHLRLAREVGYALNDFDEEAQNEIIHSSYSAIYVIGCDLKPLLSAKEWMDELRKGRDSKSNSPFIKR